MKARAARLIPVRFSFSETEARQDGWGRLSELAATGAKLLTRFCVRRGDRLELYFELPGEAFERLSAEVDRAAIDPDGYFLAELRFSDAHARLRLGRILRDILSQN